MLKLRTSLPLLALAVLVLAAFSFPADELELGSAAPMTDHKMQDVSGDMLSLNDLKGENGLLVIFSCNTCPWVMAWEDRYLTIGEQAKAQGIGMVAVNPNEAYRANGDGFDDMVARAEAQGYNFNYVLDVDHELADAFGATRTPHVYLFDKDMKLVYRGAIDDNGRDASAVEETYLADAMDALHEGEPVGMPSTKSIGCTIKRL